MLLQTIKSRNLWLWGEIVRTMVDPTIMDKIRANLQRLEQRKTEIEKELTTTISQDYRDSLNSELSNIDVLREDLQEQLEYKEHQAEFNIVYNYSYTNPFKITALQSVDVTWDNPIGESYGLTANFLQSWHNKPVNITFKGISYMGAFGGNTVGDLSQSIENDEYSNKISNDNEDNKLSKFNVATALSAGVTAASQSVSKFLNSNISHIKSDVSMEGKYDSVIDADVEKINRLLSLYGEGLFTSKEGSPYIYLLMENPGSGANNTKNENNFVTFIGHIKQFSYSERTDKPFLYDYTVQFVGEPTITNNIRNAEINAKKDASSLKLTVIASNSGYSLGYGW